MVDYEQACIHEMIRLYNEQVVTVGFALYVGRDEIFHYSCDADSKKVSVIKS